ncbi:deoxyribonuclease-1-like [Sycon ciliatum]|uniref:deoxyribonuclease-1-like n=1 Tax=Sycon ciliatum TaxID=27933 RepID=UPI0031F633EB
MSARNCLAAIIPLLIVCVLQQAHWQCHAQLQPCSLLVGSFNIQILGRSKISKTYVVEQLVKIIRRYDALFIQEVRDSTMVTIPQLFAAVHNASSTPFDYIVSDRLGRTTSKEQYALFYRSDKLNVSRWFVYNDTAADIFEREPMVAELVGAGQCSDILRRPFSIIGVHVKPDDVVAELTELVNVYNASIKRLGHGDALITGDLNADCSYLTNAEANALGLFTERRFLVLIDKDADTTVAQSSCAYDRIIVAGSHLQDRVTAGSARAYLFDTALGLNTSVTEDVSDHYPVEVRIDVPPAPLPSETAPTVESTAPASATVQGPTNQTLPASMATDPPRITNSASQLHSEAILPLILVSFAAIATTL